MASSDLSHTLRLLRRLPSQGLALHLDPQNALDCHGGFQSRQGSPTNGTASQQMSCGFQYAGKSSLKPSLSLSLTFCQGSVNLSHLSATPLVWGGQPIEITTPLSPQVTRPILWELAEVAFRCELLSLDEILYKFKATDSSDDDWGPFDADTREDREAAILGGILYFSSNLLPPPSNVNLGFAAYDLGERRENMLALFRVMRGWQISQRLMPKGIERAGEALETLDFSRDNLEEGEEDTVASTLKDCEYMVAYWYIRCFCEVYNRPPVLPHRRSI